MKNPFRKRISTQQELRRTPSGAGQDLRRPTQPTEVGTVRWQRELDDALASAGSQKKPVFALFQEVPGCAGCKQFGASVLSDPVLVDAIEHEFVPLLIHNNTPGRDAEVLEHFGEPAWNYQVVRFLDDAGRDLIPRRDRVWETGPLARRMIQALAEAGRAAPDYLVLHEQLHSDRLECFYVAQSCFWVGEAQLGSLVGVVTTEAGFMGGHEVTQVCFDPEATSVAEILSAGASRGVATEAFADQVPGAPLPADLAVPVHPVQKYRVAPSSDQKRQLQGRFNGAGLSPAQLTKLNAAAVSRTSADRFLAPHQLS